MTGREAAEYILINHFDDSPLVIMIDGKEIPVLDICMEISGGSLTIIPDCMEE